MGFGSVLIVILFNDARGELFWRLWAVGVGFGLACFVVAMIVGWIFVLDRKLQDQDGESEGVEPDLD
jgi:hypothetical protein